LTIKTFLIYNFVMW